MLTGCVIDCHITGGVRTEGEDVKLFYGMFQKCGIIELLGVRRAIRRRNWKENGGIMRGDFKLYK